MSLQQDNLGTGQIPTQPLTNSEGVLILTPSFVVAEAIALVTRQHIGQTSSPVAQAEQATSPHIEETTTHTEPPTATQTEQAATTRPRPKPRRIKKTRAALDDPPADETAQE